jgi:hypothetical protein
MNNANTLYAAHSRFVWDRIPPDPVINCPETLIYLHKRDPDPHSVPVPYHIHQDISRSSYTGITLCSWYRVIKGTEKQVLIILNHRWERRRVRGEAGFGSLGQYNTTHLLVQQTLLVHGFLHCSFAYLWKNYCSNICASRRRSLVLSRSLLRRRTE